MTVGGAWLELTSNNEISSVDAVTQSSGRDVVFAEGVFDNSPDGMLFVYSQGALNYIAGGGNVQVTYSAGLDSQGNAEVWFELSESDGIAFLSTNSWTAAGGVQQWENDQGNFAPGILSATGGSECYVLFPADPSHNIPAQVFLWSPQSQGNQVLTLGNNAQISAAGPGDVFYISNNFLKESTGSGTLTWVLPTASGGFTRFGGGLAGNGTGLLAADLTANPVPAGNGSVQSPLSVDALRQVLNDWSLFDSSAADVASIRMAVAMTDHSSDVNTLHDDSGADWFWLTHILDSSNATDVLH